MTEEFEKDFVLECAPVYTLNEILPLKPVSDLKQTCMFSNIRGLKEMSKEELISSAYKVCTDKSEFKNILYGMEENMWKFLEGLIGEKCVKYNEPFPEDFYNMKFFGIVQVFHHEDDQYLVIPEEIREMYKSIVKDEFLKEKKHFMNLNNYAKASANFYRIISLKDLADIYNSQNEDKTDENDIYNVLIKHYFDGIGYCLMETHILNEEYDGVDQSELDNFERETKNIPRFILDKDEFLKYNNEDYYENTPQIDAFREYINTICDDKGIAEDYIEQMLLMIRNEEDPKNYFKLLEIYDINLKYNQIDEFSRYVLGMVKNTRFWSKKGHTLNEISTIRKEKSNLTVLKGNNREKRVLKRKR